LNCRTGDIRSLGFIALLAIRGGRVGSRLPTVSLVYNERRITLIL